MYVRHCVFTSHIMVKPLRANYNFPTLAQPAVAGCLGNYSRWGEKLMVETAISLIQIKSKFRSSSCYYTRPVILATISKLVKDFRTG